tara:strand:- start:368 stop:1474 length:1107 start_codon:yes stop_codon:yes gene_type:complete
MNQLKNLTLGIEEEYQIIDPKSRELTSFISEFLETGAMMFKDQVKPELLQSQIEIGSNVCKNISELEDDIKSIRYRLGKFVQESDKMIAAAGTHPFSHWRDQVVTDKDRYHGLFDSMQYVAKRLLIFGMHVHIGIEDRNLQIDVMNQMRYFMPHILALSTSSPFWLGEPTGFKSYRSIIFEDLPRTGIPEDFQGFYEYSNYVDTLIESNTIDEPSKIWWDIRPHHTFPTLEFRICDCCTKADEAISIAALIQALVAKMIQLRLNNQTWRKYRGSLINENKWRAIRGGVDSKLIDFGRQEEAPFINLFDEMLEFVDDVVDDLGSRKYLESLRMMVKNGTSSDRQLKIFNKNNEINDVVDSLINETLDGC